MLVVLRNGKFSKLLKRHASNFVSSMAIDEAKRRVQRAQAREEREEDFPLRMKPRKGEILGVQRAQAREEREEGFPPHMKSRMGSKFPLIVN